MSLQVQQKQEVATANKHNQVELSVIEQVVMTGDLSKLNPEQRVVYYNRVCESLGLNPFTKPFEYINLNGKLTLYAKKDCTEQLRKINGISIVSLEDKMIDDIYIVTARAKTKDGRTDEAKGAVTIGNLKGDAKANAIMKAETKAKRRVTLSISGMGWVDESEIDSIPSARPAIVDTETGVIEEPCITDTQAEELSDLLDKCDSEYQVDFYDKLKATRDINSLQKLPTSFYALTKKAIEKRINANKASKELEITAERVHGTES